MLLSVPGQVCRMRHPVYYRALRHAHPPRTRKVHQPKSLPYFRQINRNQQRDASPSKLRTERPLENRLPLSTRVMMMLNYLINQPSNQLTSCLSLPAKCEHTLFVCTKPVCSVCASGVNSLACVHSEFLNFRETAQRQALAWHGPVQDDLRWPSCL